MPGGVGRLERAHKTVAAVDDNVALVPEDRDRQRWHRLAVSAFADPVRLACVSFCRALAGLSGQISAAVLPSLIAAFSSAVLC